MPTKRENLEALKMLSPHMNDRKGWLARDARHDIREEHHHADPHRVTVGSELAAFGRTAARITTALVFGTRRR